MPEKGTPSTSGAPVYDEDDETFGDLDMSGAEGIPSVSRADPDEDDHRAAQGGSGSGKRKKKGSGQPKSGKTRHKSKYSADDMGNASRLLDEHGADMRWNNGMREWLIWNGHTWAADEHEAMRRAMEVPRKVIAEAGAILELDANDPGGKKLDEWGKQTGNVGRLKAMLEVGKSFSGIAIESASLNPNRRVLNCPNGTLVLGKTGATFRPVAKEDMCTKSTTAPYDSSARSALWDNFLDKFLPDAELRKWAQKVAGYSMIGKNPERLIVFCWGKTSSGKSTFAEVFNDALGGYSGAFNLSMLRDNQDERSRPDLVRAFDQRVIFASETSSAWKLHADQIKRVTGKDSMAARLPHVGTAIEKVPDFTPWIVTNNAPTIEGADQALYRRLCVVLFPNTISKEGENKEFREDLAESGGLPAVLAWLVEGWNLYCQEGLSDPPDKIIEYTLKLRDQLSDLDVFLSEVCEAGGTYRVPGSDLYSAYEQWHDSNGGSARDKLSGTQFGKALTGKGFKSIIKKEDGKTVRRRLGLRLRGGVGAATGSG